MEEPHKASGTPIKSTSESRWMRTGPIHDENFAPIRPPLVMLRPASPGRPGPDSLGVAPDAVGVAGTPACGAPRRCSPATRLRGRGP